MADNLRIWNALYKTDPKHTKPFKRAGGFSGTATKPIWLAKRLTEHFGPAGSGWGMEKPEFQTVTAGDEILVFCTVALWYTEAPAADTYAFRAIVYGVGGDKVMGKNKYGPYTNDEAFKASYTDALSNAMKQIGVAADIHMGMFEDQKYLREVTEEFANGTPSPPQRVGQSAEPRGLQHVDEGDRHLIVGDGRSTYQLATGDKGPGRLAAELWASNVLEMVKTFDLMAYRDWLREMHSKTKDNSQKLAEVREKHPDLADKIDTAASELRVAVA